MKNISTAIQFITIDIKQLYIAKHASRIFPFIWGTSLSVTTEYYLFGNNLIYKLSNYRYFIIIHVLSYILKKNRVEWVCQMYYYNIE